MPTTIPYKEAALTAIPDTWEAAKVYYIVNEETHTTTVYITDSDAVPNIVVADVDLSDYLTGEQVNDLLAGKADKVTGKGLSTEDYTTAEKTKLSGIEVGAQVNAANTVIDSAYVHTDNNYTSAEKIKVSNLSGINTGDQDLSNKADLVGGKVPSSQLPAFVDDVLEYADLASFPVTGTTGILYLALDSGKIYRWSGSTYTVVSETLALGETSSTAYRGDRGKTAYDHSQLTSGNPHNVTKSEVGLGNVPNTDATVAANITQDSTHRFATDAEKTTWNAKQDGDADLTAIAGLSPTNDDIIQRKAGAWTNRTIVQLKTDLSLTKSDVGLGNADNTSDANKPISTATQSALDLKADLVGGKVPSAQLPAFVDDVLEYSSTASFPVTGTTGLIYVALDTNKVYRWGGSSYTEISPSPGSTDSVPEGSTNKYFLASRVLASVLTGLSLATNAAITAADTVLSALGKLQKQITDLIANKDASGGYVGLTLFKINFKNAANTFTSFFTNSNTAARTYTFQDRNGTIADDTDLGLKVDKSAVAYTFKANNTNGTANVADQVFQDIAEQAYTGLPSWTGTTAPSGTTNFTYQSTLIGKLFTGRINLKYATAGAAITAVTIPWPSDWPVPMQPSGFTGASVNQYAVSGNLMTGLTSFATATRAFVRRNAADTAPVIVLACGSSAIEDAIVTVTFWVT